jgi:hypothetical protein
MSAATPNVSASVRARLLNVARAQGVDFNQVLVRFALERILYRLTQSPHADRFLLKGALLFAKAAQLAENVQREDLSMLDEGRALLALKNEGMSLAQLGELMNKSRSWVCKRIACVDQLPWPVVDLIEDGITEDPEIILSLKELDQLSYNQLHIACRGMRDGTENRETIRERVRKAKEPAPVFDLVGGAGDGDGDGDGE